MHPYEGGAARGGAAGSLAGATFRGVPASYVRARFVRARDRSGDCMVRGWSGRGRRAASLGALTAALWLCVGGLFAGPPVQAASGGCAGRLARTVAFGEGELRVYKSRNQACAVTVARTAGEHRRMAVSIQPRGGAPVRDAGRFTRYAGPVTVGAISRCVYVKGSVGGGSADSGWILC